MASRGHLIISNETRIGALEVIHVLQAAAERHREAFTWIHRGPPFRMTGRGSTFVQWTLRRESVTMSSIAEVKHERPALPSLGPLGLPT